MPDLDITKNQLELMVSGTQDSNFQIINKKGSS
jgi:hypothetical protein